MRYTVKIGVSLDNGREVFTEMRLISENINDAKKTALSRVKEEIKKRGIKSEAAKHDHAASYVQIEDAIIESSSIQAIWIDEVIENKGKKEEKVEKPIDNITDGGMLEKSL